MCLSIFQYNCYRMMYNMNKSIFVLTIVLIILHCSNSTLSVHNAYQLGLNPNLNKLQNIPFTTASFGHIPIGQTLIGRLMLSPNNSDQCNSTQTPELSDFKEDYFILVPRGNCKFVNKALNVQKLGAKMMIVVNNDPLVQQQTMTDNGQGYKVDIPAIMISYADGQRLIRTLQDFRELNQSIMLNVTFPGTKSSRPQITFILSSSSRLSYSLVKQFSQSLRAYQSYIDFQIFYSIEQCPVCLQSDCLFGHMYCISQYTKQPGAKGRDIINQQIREMVVFENYPDIWWEWMVEVDRNCAKIVELKNCSEEYLRKAGGDVEGMQKKFEESFLANGDNLYLNRSAEIIKSWKVTKYPSIYLNGHFIPGNMNADLFLQDLCSGFVDLPPFCQKPGIIHDQISDIDENVDESNPKSTVDRISQEKSQQLTVQAKIVGQVSINIGLNLENPKQSIKQKIIEVLNSTRHLQQQI